MTALIHEKRRLIAELKSLKLDIATGQQPTIGQILDQIILNAFNQTVIQ